MPPRLEDPRLNSPAWLREKYHDEGLSQREIADIVGCSKRPVNNRMEEYGIEKRPAHHLPNTLDEPFSDEFVAILDGELLGDGCLYPRYENSQGAVYQHGTAKSAYLDWLTNLFESEGFSTQRGEHMKREDREGWNDTMNYKMWTLNYTSLLDEYQRWYPNGEKRVPDDIEISPLTLRHWYIGDGSYSVRDCGFEEIKLCTYGFTDSGRTRLVRELESAGIQTNVQGSGVLYVTADSRERFFEYMAPPPGELEDVYGYKWGDRT